MEAVSPQGPSLLSQDATDASLTAPKPTSPGLSRVADAVVNAGSAPLDQSQAANASVSLLGNRAEDGFGLQPC